MPRPFRDRRGRGLRGPLSPPQVPLSRTRAERFDDLVLESVERLERRWEEQLRGVEFAVEPVPALDPAPGGRGIRFGGDGRDPGDRGDPLDPLDPLDPVDAVVPVDPVDPVPLGRLIPRTGTHPPRIVIYRRPVETRALDQRELGELVHDVVVEQVADLLGVEPRAVDPRYDDGDDED